ncbi:putative ATPase subunit gpP of terminase [Anoxybacillus vitaminiphilus]|uniref:Putative ATPase subunit gpP of terminase n=1 Tax=Paranoxybacillus vitaminiphilus TaxID=581036 RepID=A0A327Y1G7_9BACL|nr:putative ATPase subunit gpP of terminase [Anoxybacillus vitaminiphilus]
MNHAHEIETLLIAMKETKNKRMYERYQALYLYLQGYTKEDIAKIIGRSEKTVYNYVNAYKEHGMAA